MILRAYITNLGKYNEGEFLGKWHEFPTTKQEIRDTLKEIGIDGVHYEEFFITDYECDIDGVCSQLGEYANIDELNMLAVKIEDLTGFDQEIYEAAIESGENAGGVQNLINLTDNLDCYCYLDGIYDDADIGYYYVEDSGIFDTKGMGALSNYIDYERFGRDVRLDEGGTLTANGYIYSNGDRFIEDYDGINVPDEYRVFALPRPERAASKTKPSRDGGAR